MAPGRTGMGKRMRTVSVFRSPATSWVTCYVWGWGCPREAPGPLHTPALSWPTMHHTQLLATVAVAKLGFSVHMSMCGVCVWGASAHSYWGHPGYGPPLSSLDVSYSTHVAVSAFLVARSLPCPPGSVGHAYRRLHSLSQRARQGLRGLCVHDVTCPPPTSLRNSSSPGR